MEEIKLKLSSFWDLDSTPVHPVILLKKGAERRNRLRELIVEVMRNVAPSKPTARQLQKLCRVRRNRFLPLLKSFVEKGVLIPCGSGTKGDPYKYVLNEQSLKE